MLQEARPVDQRSKLCHLQWLLCQDTLEAAKHTLGGIRTTVLWGEMVLCVCMCWSRG